MEYVQCLALNPCKGIYQNPNHSRSIVAVHGLNGNSEKTWTASNKVNWLRDLLPVDIPNARIFTWGYDAKTHSPEHVSIQTVRDHAVGLISDLCREREETKVLGVLRAGFVHRD